MRRELSSGISSAARWMRHRTDDPMVPRRHARITFQVAATSSRYLGSGTYIYFGDGARMHAMSNGAASAAEPVATIKRRLLGSPGWAPRGVLGVGPQVHRCWGATGPPNSSVALARAASARDPEARSYGASRRVPAIRPAPDVADDPHVPPPPAWGSAGIRRGPPRRSQVHRPSCRGPTPRRPSSLGRSAAAFWHPRRCDGGRSPDRELLHAAAHRSSDLGVRILRGGGDCATRMEESRRGSRLERDNTTQDKCNNLGGSRTGCGGAVSIAPRICAWTRRDVVNGRTLHLGARITILAARVRSSSGDLAPRLVTGARVAARQPSHMGPPRISCACSAPRVL